MGKLAFWGLLLLALLLFFASRRKWVGHETLQTLANTSAIVAFIAAVLVFIVPTPPSNIDDKAKATDTPGTRVITSDDFSDPTSGWPSGSGSFWFRGYRDGRYVIFFDGDGDEPAFVAWLAAGKFSDIGLQVTVLGPFKEYDIARRGIGFGSSSGQREGVYAFTFQTDGTCEIVQYRDGEYSYLQPLFVGNVPDFDRTKSHHVLKVEIKYREVVGYVDGELCVQGIIPDYSSGYVGLLATASGGDSGYIVGETYFDDFVVYAFPSR